MTTPDAESRPRRSSSSQQYPPRPDHTHAVHGVWTAIAVAGVAFALVLSVTTLVIVSTRPTVDMDAVNALVDSAVSDRTVAAAAAGPATHLPSDPAVGAAVESTAPLDAIPDGSFTTAQIAEHSDASTSCWVIVDGLVFDVTEASKLHPAQFRNCGGDSSEVYHKQHGPVIRDKMMDNLIGQVWTGGSGAAAAATPPDEVDDSADDNAIGFPAGCPEEDIGGPIDPQTTLFVEAGSWDVNQLMLVVEKDCRSIVFIDGATHTMLGRIDDLGHQLHAPTPSPDGSTVYVIARDGWLSKIDLTTLEVQASIDVGVSSRGTGLTDDGKYLLVGNFEPNTATLLDAESLEVLRVFEAVGSINGGPETPSKVGGIVEHGTKLYMVLKDVNAVWEIETAQPDFPVRRYEDLGDGQTPLHDAYLTPDGRHLIAAVQGANAVWVLDTATGEEVAEVPTGETPHTGPGATVGNLTFVPTLDPEGVVSVIDTTTWTNVTDIDVGGPGLFIRHNPTAETAEEYPYVWAETAFGDAHDEIYVIDVASLEIVRTLRPVPGESSWHPEFTYDGSSVYVVSQTGNAIVVYDAETLEEVTRLDATTPSAVFNMGIRSQEAGL
jgi:YVTN family beta-propeller protein